jgi:hypothetical protein
MATIIELSEKHTEHADAVGALRQRSAEARGLRGKNGAPEELAAALHLHIVGTRCEAAAALWASPVFWNSGTRELDEPDLDYFIDVKGREGSGGELIIQRGGVAGWAYLLVYSEHPFYEIVGWCWGYEGKKAQYWRDPKGGRPAFFVPVRIGDTLRRPEELIEELRRRQRSREHGEAQERRGERSVVG